jgi:hypothetical protein
MATAAARRWGRHWTAVLQFLAAVLLPAFAPFAGAAEVSVRSDAPQRYTVVEGDTLWDISARFLAEPWMWPEVWQMNPGIENPDLIHPGDLIELVYVDGAPVLRVAANTGSGASTATGTEPTLPTVKLSPQVRREPLLSPIPAIPLALIEANLSRDSIISEAEFAAAPYILGEATGHALAGTGDDILARGQWLPGQIQYDIIRSGELLRAPGRREPLGLEAILVGSATISRFNEQQAILMVDSADLEIRVGDRLLPRQAPGFESIYRPVPPRFAVEGEIISIGRGKAVAGRNDSLVLNVGSSDGLAVGHLLTVRGADRIIKDQLGEPGGWQKFKQVLGFDDGHKAVYPGDAVASLLIYRVFDKTSFGLVLSSNQPLQVNDRVVAP